MEIQKAVIKGETLELHPLKAVYWNSKETLLIADFHVGKSAHFRRNGIMVHAGVDQVNIKNLNQLIKYYQPQKVIFLGDLFHSKMNGEWISLHNLMKHYPTIIFELVIGNHDILPKAIYKASNLILHENSLIMDPFLFTHKPLPEPADSYYNLSGHIHPGILLRGEGRQSMRMPCFYFSEWQGILPAFGKFTGLSILRPRKNDQVFVPVSQEVICL